MAGRHGEAPGGFTSRLDIERDDRPLLRQELGLGPVAPGWSGPAVLGGAKASGMVVVVGEGVGRSRAAAWASAGRSPRHRRTVVAATAPGAARLRQALDEGTARLGR